MMEIFKKYIIVLVFEVGKFVRGRFSYLFVGRYRLLLLFDFSVLV